VAKSSPAKPARRVAGNWRKVLEKQQFYSFGAAADHENRPNQDHQNCGTVCGSPPIRPYSELSLVLPSKTPASRTHVSGSPMLRLLRENYSKMFHRRVGI
jgi:hypothetical protein